MVWVAQLLPPEPCQQKVLRMASDSAPLECSKASDALLLEAASKLGDDMVGFPDAIEGPAALKTACTPADIKPPLVGLMALTFPFAASIAPPTVVMRLCTGP